MAVRVVLEDVADAIDHPEGEGFDLRLDLATGVVEMIVSRSHFGDVMSEELRTALEAQPDRFEPIPRLDSREEFLWMADFANALEDEDIRDRLSVALEGRGSFRRFKAVLAGYGDLRVRWYAVRAARLVTLAEDWLRSLDTELEIVRRPKVEPVASGKSTAPQPQRPPDLRVDHLLLLGASEPASAPDRVRRVLSAKGRGRALFKQLVRDLCESKGVGYRKRFIEGARFELEDTTLRHDDDRVEIEVTVPAAVRNLF